MILSSRKPDCPPFQFPAEEREKSCSLKNVTDKELMYLPTKVRAEKLEKV